MTEPTPASNQEATLTVMDAPPQEPDTFEEVPPTPYAVASLVTVPIPNAPNLDIQWTAPNEGPADSYVLEVGTNSYDLAGTTLRVLIEGLEPLVDFPVRLTAHIGTNSGTLEIPTVQVQAPVTETAQGA